MVFQACAACKYQRRRCTPDCPLAPYFPQEKQKQFLNAHKLFGVKFMLKTLKDVPPPQQAMAMNTMISQATARANDPVGGCHRMICELQQQIEYNKVQLQLVLRQLAHFRPEIITKKHIINVLDRQGMDQQLLQHHILADYQDSQGYNCQDMRPVLCTFDEEQKQVLLDSRELIKFLDSRELIKCSDKVVLEEDITSSKNEKEHDSKGAAS